MRSTRLVPILVLSLLVTGGCVQYVSPARTTDDYRHHAVRTAEAALSAVETARITVEAARAGDVLPPYTAVVLSEAESDADAAQATFSGVQPPDDRSDRMRVELLALLADADEALADARIAARRDQVRGEKADALRTPLERAGRDLDAFIGEHT